MNYERRPIAGYEGRYDVAYNGDIISLRQKSVVRDKILSPRKVRGGYHHVYLFNGIPGEEKNFRVHRLVCIAFHGPPPSDEHEVNHIDGNKINNFASNLEWVTPGENMRHAVRTGMRAHLGAGFVNVKNLA